MNIPEAILGLGFDRVAVLDGTACGITAKRLILCFACYEAEREESAVPEAVIHPYYPVSQQAYLKAKAFAADCEAHGIRVSMADDIRIKPVLNRLPFLRRGRNTLNYLPEKGSRFHVQVLVSEEELPVTDVPEPEEHGYACGSCRKCEENCPGGAIGPEGFRREKCLRWWMLNGKVPPEEIRRHMGNRFLGCDACEACCPMNPEGKGRAEVIPLADILDGKANGMLRELIGPNYARTNRMLMQAGTCAGSLGRTDLRPRLETLAETSASPAVREAAEAALGMLTSSLC